MLRNRKPKAPRLRNLNNLHVIPTAMAVIPKLRNRPQPKEQLNLLNVNTQQNPQPSNKMVSLNQSTISPAFSAKDLDKMPALQGFKKKRNRGRRRNRGKKHFAAVPVLQNFFKMTNFEDDGIAGLSEKEKVEVVASAMPPQDSIVTPEHPDLPSEASVKTPEEPVKTPEVPMETSETPVDENCFEEVEVASSEGDVKHIPVGFRRNKLFYLSYKKKSFFRAKFYKVSSERTIVNCMNMQENNEDNVSVDVDIVSEAEYDECENDNLEQSDSTETDKLGNLIDIIEIEDSVEDPNEVEDEKLNDFNEVDELSERNTCIEDNDEFYQGRSLVQEELDNWKSHLLGLEYLIEIQNLSAQLVWKYHCVLCDEVINVSECAATYVINHISGRKHVLKYLDKHFPACDYKFTENNNFVALQKLCEKIDEELGYYFLCITNLDYYSENRPKIEGIVQNAYHPSENDFTLDVNDFEKTVDSELREDVNHIISDIFHKLEPKKESTSGTAKAKEIINKANEQGTHTKVIPSKDVKAKDISNKTKTSGQGTETKVTSVKDVKAKDIPNKTKASSQQTETKVASVKDVKAKDISNKTKACNQQTETKVASVKEVKTKDIPKGSSQGTETKVALAKDVKSKDIPNKTKTNDQRIETKVSVVTNFKDSASSNNKLSDEVKKPHPKHKGNTAVASFLRLNFSACKKLDSKTACVGKKLTSVKDASSGNKLDSVEGTNSKKLEIVKDVVVNKTESVSKEANKKLESLKDATTKQSESVKNDQANKKPESVKNDQASKKPETVKNDQANKKPESVMDNEANKKLEIIKDDIVNKNLESVKDEEANKNSLNDNLTENVKKKPAPKYIGNTAVASYLRLNFSAVNKLPKSDKESEKKTKETIDPTIIAAEKPKSKIQGTKEIANIVSEEFLESKDQHDNISSDELEEDMEEIEDLEGFVELSESVDGNEDDDDYDDHKQVHRSKEKMFSKPAMHSKHCRKRTLDKENSRLRQSTKASAKDRHIISPGTSKKSEKSSDNYRHVKMDSGSSRKKSASYNVDELAPRKLSAVDSSQYSRTIHKRGTQDSTKIVNVFDDSQWMPMPHGSRAITPTSELLRIIRSEVRRQSRSPVRRIKSPLRQVHRASLKSPERRYSRSPLRRKSRSPYRKTSRSPLRKRSRSPLWKSTHSPSRRYSRSPLRRRSRSPLRHGSRSPRRRSRSPLKRRSRSSLRSYSRSPVRGRSRSPLGRHSRSPRRRYSRSPQRRYSRSPLRRHSRSPFRKRSRSPMRRRSRSPVKRRYSRSPLQRHSSSHASYDKLLRGHSTSPEHISHNEQYSRNVQKFHKHPHESEMGRVRNSSKMMSPSRSNKSRSFASGSGRDLIDLDPVSDEDESLYFDKHQLDDTSISPSSKIMISKLLQKFSVADANPNDPALNKLMQFMEAHSSELQEFMGRPSSVSKPGKMDMQKIDSKLHDQTLFLQQYLLANLAGNVQRPGPSAVPNLQQPPNYTHQPFLQNQNLPGFGPSASLPPPPSALPQPTQQRFFLPNVSVPPPQIFPQTNQPIQNPMQPMPNPVQPMSNPIQPMQNPIQPMQNPMQPIQNPIQPNLSQPSQSFLRQPKVPSEGIFKDLKATVNKLFGANESIRKKEKNKQKVPSYVTQPDPAKWDLNHPDTRKFNVPSDSQNMFSPGKNIDFRGGRENLSARDEMSQYSSGGNNSPGQFFSGRPGDRSQIPGISVPPPDAKVSFCDAPRSSPKHNLFPVVSGVSGKQNINSSTSRGNVSDVKVSLAQRLASVLVKVGMTDVPAPLLQEMLMKIGAFSSSPRQDISEGEIVLILKKLGYL